MSYSYESEILAQSINFEGEKRARTWLKLRNVALKTRPQGMDGHTQEDAVKDSKAARQAFIDLVPFLPAEFSVEKVVYDFCGFGKEWGATGRMVQEFAAANGVDQALAAELVGRQMTVAQDYTQATRGTQVSRFMDLVNRAMDEANDLDADCIPDDMEDVITAAYNRAAKWNKPADGLLIADFALEFELVLPSWADALKANMPSAEEALAARKRLGNRAAAQAAAEAQADADIMDAHGEF